LAALSHAAYYAKDLPLAIWAVEKWLAAKPEEHAAHASAAVIYAAAGDEPKSREHLARLGTSGQSDELPRLARRLASWKALYDNALAHAARHPLPDIPKQEVPAAAAAPAPPSPRPGTALSALWSDCPQTAGNSSAYSGSGSYSGGYSQYGSGQSDIPLLPPLPSPCAGVPLPRMALFDVVMIRTEESVGYGSGVNLLEGLKLTLGYSWNETRNSSDGGQASISQSIARTAGLPNGGITYSLNIFNVDTNHTEVIARPTLIALDRLGSTFFSGSNVSISISGVDNGSLQDKSIGTALSITPTFIDDERMLLAIKVDRSYVEPVQLPGFNESLTTSKNSVTTNVMLRFGETVILSGLREREKNRIEDGVPVVNRIPIVQYLFNRTVQTEFNKHLVVLVTPRKPANFNGHTEKGDRYHEELKRINMRGETPASIASELAGITRTYQENLQQIVNALGVSTYYSEFRTGDMLPGDVSLSPHSLKRVFKDLRTLFYY
jgi:opacity protein-like surface antigen